MSLQLNHDNLHVQIRRNVSLGPLGSLHDQPNPHTGKVGFFLHFRLGLVGWITYWCNGDSALTVDVEVELINIVVRELVVREKTWCVGVCIGSRSVVD